VQLRNSHSNDNGLAETKNGAVIRKPMGYGYIPAGHAVRMQPFYTAYFNPYLNYHRPCAQPDITFDEKGRRRYLYRRYQTPLETLLPLPNPAQYLRPGLTPRRLTTHRGNPQRHRSREAHAAGETPTLRAVARGRGRTVEMTEEKIPQPQKRGFFSSLESAKPKGALSTFPPPRLRLLDWFRI